MLTRVSSFVFRSLAAAAAVVALATQAQTAPRFKVLVFAPPTGDLGHASYLKESRTFFPKLAAQYGFQADFTEDWGDLNASKLAQYKVIVFLDNRPEQQAQRDAFKAYMDNGGAWIGCHFAGFALNDSKVVQNWDWYHNTFLGSGEYLSNVWKPVPATLKVEDKDFPGTAGLPDRFKSAANEWYRWKNDLTKNKDIRILLSIDPSSYPLGTKAETNEIWYSGYYPVVWTNKSYRMVYLNMGHNDIDYGNNNADLSLTFANETQNRIITDFLLWAGGVSTTGSPR